MSQVLAPPVGGVRGALRHPPLRTFVAGTVIGGAALGAAVALVGLAVQAVPGLRWAAVAVAAAATVSGVRGTLPVRWPHRRGQVPVQWGAAQNLSATGLAWGAILGMGFLTHLASPALWAVAALGTLLPAVLAVVVFVAFALARAAAVLVGAAQESAASCGRRPSVELARLNTTDPRLRAIRAALAAGVLSAAVLTL